MILKVYEVDPLVCPKCQGAMKILSIVDQAEIIQKILWHLHLWDTRNHAPPPESPSYIPKLTYDDSDSQCAYYYWN
ncbi:MAG: hypothetical protein RBT11_11880 [Desulfobacterales bacterium]|nr:hypothetical protein [Desulfobacterales bacterium]